MIGREGRQRARARLPARAAGGRRRQRRVDRRHRARGAPRRRRRRARPRARRQDPRPGRGGRALERRHRRVLRRQRTWQPDALRELVGAFADPKVGYACGQVALRQRRRDEPGGPVLALRDGAARARVAAVLGHRAATARSTRRAARPTSRSTRSWATTSRFRSTWSSAAGARSTCRSACATEKMVPSIEGEFARKRRMMSHAWPIVLRGGLLSPRGYPPLYALMIGSHRVLRYAAPFLHVGALVASFVLGADALVLRARPRAAARADRRRAARARRGRCARCSSSATTS